MLVLYWIAVAGASSVGTISHNPASIQLQPSTTLAKVEVVIVTSTANLEKAKQIILGQKLLALDCEGVSLCRNGCITIIQLSTPTHCFLFDMLESNTSAPMEIGNNTEVVQFLKSVLEDRGIIKVIHDCKMDSDALLHRLGITLRSVHDTQICDQILRGKGTEVTTGMECLNIVLSRNGVEANTVRDKGVYDVNPAFWATRPMTPQMIQWAAGDVASMFQLFEIQMSQIEGGEMERELVKASNYNLRILRHSHADVRLRSCACVRIGTHVQHSQAHWPHHTLLVEIFFIHAQERNTDIQRICVWSSLERLARVLRAMLSVCDEKVCNKTNK
jgi:hypothetical protein